jgi:hypothetical protein
VLVPDSLPSGWKFTPNLARMGYTRGVVVQYQYQGAGIGIVSLLVKNHLYPIPDQYQSFTGNAAIKNKEVTQKYIANNI